MIISDTLRIDLELELSSEEYELELEATKESFEMEAVSNFIIQHIDGEPYEGAYLIDPEFNRQILPTQNRILTDNITVNSIEVSRVSNPTGGATVYIGGIFDA